MRKDQVDQGLSFKKRARRRLVGAIALVLLMVIILPTLLEDREVSMQQEDVEIVMPNADLDASLVLETETNLGFEESAVQAVDTDESATQKSAVSEVVELPKVKTLVVKPEPKKATKKVAKVEQKTSAKKADVKKVVAKKSIASNQFYVQIGVFSDPSNIKKLQVKIDDLGYKSLTEKITTDTGVKTRLRTESFTGRNEAAIALENIKDAGLAGMVVNQK